MLSVGHRKEGVVSSALCFCAFAAIFFGVISGILSVGTSSKNQERAALHYIDKAHLLDTSVMQMYSLYQLSEQSMVSAIAADPFNAHRWQVLSDVLFTLGKDQSALVAKKIANRLKSPKESVAFSTHQPTPRIKLAMLQSKQR